MEHKHLVSGSVQATKKDANQVAFWDACTKLDSASVMLKVFFSETERRAYYIAYPSAYVDSKSFETQLCAALPNSQNFQGDGLYFLQTGVSEYVGILKYGQKFERLTFARVEDALGNLNLPYFDVATCASGSLVRYNTTLDEQAYNFLKKTVEFFFFGAISLLFVSVALEAGSFFLKQKNADIKKHLNIQIGELATELAEKTDIYDQTAELRRLSGVVAKSGGFIDYYNVGSGQDSTYRIITPEWITQDYVQSLGNVVAQRDLNEGIITFTKEAQK